MDIEIRLDTQATERWWASETFRDKVREQFSGYGLGALVSILGSDGFVLDCWGQVKGKADNGMEVRIGSAERQTEAV